MKPSEQQPRGDAADEGWRKGLRWFAAEFAVVVSGVLVALALNAWWSGRQEVAQEHVYLRQLLSDLEETEQSVTEANAAMSRPDRAGGLLVRSFQMPEPPPADSLLAWVRAASRYRYPDPVLGTAEALVSTGDLTLIRDNDLRTAIVGYLRESRLLAEDFQRAVERWENARGDLFRSLDYQEVIVAVIPTSERDSLAREYPDFPVPPGARRARFPFDADAFLSDRGAYHALVQMNTVKTNMRWDREALGRATRRLRARVEGVL